MQEITLFMIGMISPFVLRLEWLPMDWAFQIKLLITKWLLVLFNTSRRDLRKDFLVPIKKTALAMKNNFQPK